MRKSLKRNLLVASLAFVSLPASACSIDPYIGAVCAVAFNFCPRGWAIADGSLLPIGQNQALFSLLGTTYGGDGRTTFALPDLRGRSIVGSGAGPSLSPVFDGEQGGAESVTLLSGNLPSHSHSATTAVTAKLRGTNSAGTVDTPQGNVLSKYARTNIYSAGAATADMGTSAIAATATTTVGPAGSNIPFSVRSPYLGMTTCIAIQGIFPSRP